MKRWALVPAVVLLLLLAARAVWAHPPVATAALVNIDKDGEVVIHVVHDALAFALNDTSLRIGDREMYALLDGPEEALAAAFADGRERFLAGFHLTADERDVPFEVLQAPDLASMQQWKAEHSRRTLPCKLEFVIRAQVPAGATGIALQFPEILADTLLVVTRSGAEPFSMPLNAGEQSPEIEVSMAEGLAGSGHATFDGPQSDAPPHAAANPTSALGVAWRFVKLGFTHIIPHGPDHCLFVLGLFLLRPRIKPVLSQISMFTVAHTITLTLTSLHIIGLPSSVVEPTIALSIAFIGVENLCTTEVHRWRLAVAFLFGLVHGMGVATAFNDAGFPPGQLVASLASFTVGVEAGHVAILAAAFAALGWTRDRPWYRQRVAIPLSLGVTAIALVWIAQRLSAAA
jgi:hypothetical protein